MERQESRRCPWPPALRRILGVLARRALFADRQANRDTTRNADIRDHWNRNHL
jgi:hypothetical protein